VRGTMLGCNSYWVDMSDSTHIAPNLTSDNMEWHIQEAHQRTERGVKHLVTATKHQNKYRKSVRRFAVRACLVHAMLMVRVQIVCFFSILVVAAVGVGLYLYLRSRH